MNVDRKYLPWFLVMFLAGSAIGFLIGAYSGSQFGVGLVLNNGLQRDAKVINQQLDALEQLRAGNSEAAVEIFESGIDDSLILFDPVEPYPRLKQNTIDAIDEAVKNAFDYRRRYPRNSSRPHVDQMLDSLFQRHNLN